MIILTTIILTIIAVIALLLIIALFVKKEFVIEKQTIIQQPKAIVFDYIKHIKNQDNYSKWNMTDPNMKKKYSGTDAKIGFIYSWDSTNKNVGAGEQEIKKIIEGQKIEMEIRFIRPFKGVSYASITTDSMSEQQTKVTWVFNSTSKYPFNLMSLLMEGMLGKDLETGLGNLKTILER